MISSIQNFLNTVKPDTIFTVFVSISIFIIGVILKWSFEAWKRRKYLRGRTVFFVQSAKSILKPMEKQATKYEELANSISDLNNRRLIFGIVSELNFFFFSPEIIANIHAYNALKWLPKNKINESTLKNISKVITAIQQQFDHSKYNFTNFQNKENRDAEYWHQASNAIFRYNDFLINQYRLNGEPSNDNFFHDFNEQIYNWLQERDDYNLEHIINELIIPLKQICKKHSGDQRALQILPTLKECSNIFDRFKKNRENYSELFLESANKVKNHRKTFKEEIKSLEKLT